MLLSCLCTEDISREHILLVKMELLCGPKAENWAFIMLSPDGHAQLTYKSMTNQKPWFYKAYKKREMRIE